MNDNSVTIMLNNLREGHDLPEAQSIIWDRFFHRLKALAEKRIHGHTRRVVDGEDIAIDALTDFFAEVGADGAYPQVTNRESLWPLLAKITSRKAINEFKKLTAKKRGGGNVRGESVFVHGDDMNRGIEQIERELTPEFADELFIGFNEVLSELKEHDQKYHDVAVLRLKGYSTTEIAEQLGYENSKTIERMVKQIRILWKSHHSGLARLTIRGDLGDQFEVNLNEEPTIVGRQREGERDPYWTGVSDVKGQPTRRIVIAKKSEKLISRNHLSIQIRDENQIEVTNCSRKSRALIDSHFVIGPGNVWTGSSSCSIELPGNSLWIELT